MNQFVSNSPSTRDQRISLESAKRDLSNKIYGFVAPHPSKYISQAPFTTPMNRVKPSASIRRQPTIA